MPLTPVPDQYLSSVIAKMQRQLDELTRAVGKPSDSVRDTDNNVLGMVPGVGYPVVAARGQDASLSMANGAVAVTDETGKNYRDVYARTVNGALTGDSHGVHHGDVGVAGLEFYNHYGDHHGNGYGFHYGPVGDGTTQNQINALNIFSTGHFGTQHGDVGTPTEFWQLYGTIHAPSERSWKTDVREFPEASRIVDEVPVFRWRWKPAVGLDGDEHAGPMVGDVESVAPWLVRHSDGTAVRSLTDRDFVGVLWAALRDTRAQVRALENRVAELEKPTVTE
jgi:hypothetical protein